MITLAEINAEFEELDDPTDRMTYLVEIGKSLPPLDDRLRTEPNRVLGCQSMVWLVAQERPGTPPTLTTRVLWRLKGEWYIGPGGWGAVMKCSKWAPASSLPKSVESDNPAIPNRNPDMAITLLMAWLTGEAADGFL